MSYPLREGAWIPGDSSGAGELAWLSGARDAILQGWFVCLSAHLGGNESSVDTDRLVEAAQSGDRQAQQRLYQQTVRKVFRSVRAMCRSEAEAEDVVQDTYVQALSNLSSYHPRPGSRFVSWLVTIGLNAARKRMRWHRRAVLTDEEPEGAEEQAADGKLEDARNKHALIAALGELPERDREVVAMRFGAEMSWAEVANALGISEASARKSGERVRDKLVLRVQEMLATRGEDP